MNTPSPFAEVQRLQDEQRDGWVPDYPQQIAELNQRLIERQESFQAQLIRIEDTWRERLKEKTEEANIYLCQVTSAIRQVEACDTLNRNLLVQNREKDAKIAEQAAQIVALRGCLEHLRSKDWFNDPTNSDDDVACILDANQVRAALSTPAPKVIPLEEAKALADALENLRDKQNGPPLERHKDHWQAAYDTANKVLAEFNTKHPL